MARNNKKADVIHFCRECANVTRVYEFHTLSIKGEPTMGKCPYWTQSKCVLLSQKACVKHFKMKL